jgi:AraC-like DNA-binding protein
LQVTGATHAAVTHELAGLQTASSIARLAGLLRILDVLHRHEKLLVPIAQASMQAHGNVRGGDEQQPRRIDGVLGWIRRHMARELTVAAAAGVARVTPGAFSRYFRHEVGKTFTEYVNDVRCSEACVLLRRSDKAVAVVAQQCGFSTLSHFNRQFRLRYGMTPREFRAQL